MKMKFSIGVYIQNARIKAGITQAELARRLKVSRMTISRYETGTSETSIKQLMNISRILNVPLSHFFSNENAQDTTHSDPYGIKIPSKVPQNTYVLPLEQYRTKSKRVNGFRKPALLGLAIPDPMRVVSGKAFVYYKTHRQLPEILVKEVNEFFEYARKLNPNRGIYIGRGFYVPGIEHPPGPRTSGIFVAKEYLNNLEKFYTYAIENGYDVKGADIALILHPFIHPYFPPLQENPEVAYPGGSVTPSRDNETEILIESIWGHDEAIQTLPHDTFLVDFTKNIIVEKKIQSKETALKAGPENKYVEIPVAPSHKTIQTLNDLQILQIAHDYQKVYEKFKHHRLEFILQPEGVIYRECIPFTYTEGQTIDTNSKGQVYSIRTLKNVTNAIEDESIDIVSIDPQVIKNRNMEILTSLAIGRRKKFVVIFPGSVTTAHSATIFREQGHTLVYGGNKKFNEGDYVEICIKNGDMVAQIIDTKTKENVITFNISTKAESDHIGAKAFRLLEVSKHNIPIPKTIVVSTEVYRRFLKENHLDLGIKLLMKTIDTDERHTKCTILQKAMIEGKLNKSDDVEIMKSLSKLNTDIFALRSSATCEDGIKTSFAGQFDSFLNVKSKDVVQTIKKVWASAVSPMAVDYMLKNAIEAENVAMAVIIEELIQGQISGVMFTKNVNGGEANSVIIEATKGLGENVVNGTAQIDRVVIDKKTLTIKSRKGKTLMNNEDIGVLLALSKQIEGLYRTPQDIEWTIIDGKPVVLQTRPITT